MLHAIRAGKVPVVMPRRAKLGEHVDDHQVANAEALARAGKAVVVHEGAQLLPAVAQALAMQRQLSDTGARLPDLVRLVGERLQQCAALLR